MKNLSVFIRENLINESEYSQLLKEIQNLTQAKNASEFNSIFEVISSILQEMEQTVAFSGHKISNLEPKSFYCVASRYDDIKHDAPRFHGDTLGSISIGPGMGKVAHITYNYNLGGNLDKTGGAFVVVDAWGGGYKKDIFANEQSENSIRCLGPDSDVKNFVTNLVKNISK